MTFNQLYRIVMAHKLGLIFIFLLTVAGILTLFLLQKPKFTAVATVVLDTKFVDQISGTRDVGVTVPGVLDTQFDIVTSKRTLNRVIKIADLKENAFLISSWGGNGDYDLWLLNFLEQNLSLSSSNKSNVIKISFTSEIPVLSSLIANAVAKAYIDINLELKTDPAKQFNDFFAKQSSDARARLEVAQKNLSQYMEDNGITSTDNRLDHEVAKLNDLSRRLTEIQSLITEGGSKKAYSGSDTISDIIQNPLINQLKVQIATTKAKLKDLLTIYGENHPQVESLKAELANMESELSDQTSKVVRSVGTTYSVNKRSERVLQKALAEQKEKVVQLNNQRDELNVLTRDLEIAQRAYDSIVLKITQTDLESKSDQTNVTILSYANTPNKPSGPNAIFVMFAAGFVGFFFGILYVFISEFFNRRIRCTEDVTLSLGIPVLANIHSGKKLIKVIEKS